jgi:hypothetical protein
MERVVNFPQNVPYGTTHFEKGRTWEYVEPGMWKSIGGSGGGGGGGGGIEEAPSDGLVYGRQNEQWVEVVSEEYEPPSFELLRTTGKTLEIKKTYLVNIPTANPYVNLPKLSALDEGAFLVISDGVDGWSSVSSALTVNLNGPLQGQNVGQLSLDLANTQITFVWDGASWWVFSTMTNTAGIEFLTDAPEDGNIYARQDGNWVQVTSGGGSGGGPVEWDDVLNKPQPIKDLAAENAPKVSIVSGGSY